MKIILDKEESEKYFYNALCGADVMAGYGVSMDYTDEDGKKARASLNKQDPKRAWCREDVWMEILRTGGALILVDDEGDGENTKSITLEKVHERVQLTDSTHLMDMINENGDGTTDDVILQTVFFGEVIFG